MRCLTGCLQLRLLLHLPSAGHLLRAVLACVPGAAGNCCCFCCPQGPLLHHLPELLLCCWPGRQLLLLPSSPAGHLLRAVLACVLGAAGNFCCCGAQEPLLQHLPKLLLRCVQGRRLLLLPRFPAGKLLRTSALWTSAVLALVLGAAAAGRCCCCSLQEPLLQDPQQLLLHCVPGRQRLMLPTFSAGELLMASAVLALVLGSPAAAA
jgi:hypothetical protein